MNFSKLTLRVLLSFSLLCTFYLSANVLTEADFVKAQEMKDGKVSLTKKEAYQLEKASKTRLEMTREGKETVSVAPELGVLKLEKATGLNPSFRDCVNDDSTSDSYGDTCSGWYDLYDYPGSYGCTGGYNDDDFDAAAQCCVCQDACGVPNGDGSTCADDSDDATCDDNWDSCLQSLLAIGSEYYDACSAEDCQGGAGGACDGLVVPGLTDECANAASNIANGSCPDPCGGTDTASCPDGFFDCLGDGTECIPGGYFCDGSSEFCNASWGPDCSNGADEGLDICGYEDACSAEPTCANSSCGNYLGAGYTCDELAGYGIDCSLCTDECAALDASACDYSFSNYGSYDCDTAATEFGLDCATLEYTYGWVCSGCECPLDNTALTCEEQGLWDCGDGQCIPTSYVCDGSSEWGNASWGPDCANGADENFDSCCASGSYADDLCNPTPYCEDEAACNTGAEGDCTYADAGFNCDGSIADGYHVDCAGTVLSDSYLSWQGDGYCDNGSFGVNYLCCEFNYDNGDCGDA
jgi:hypothetical protein